MLKAWWADEKIQPLELKEFQWLTKVWASVSIGVAVGRLFFLPSP